jgi:U3 small nucleolar RNA-associated protein 25
MIVIFNLYFNYYLIQRYDDNKSVDRGRYLFYHKRVHFLLVTERFHFYKRYRIRGANHVIFYDLPNYAEFYSNFCNYIPDIKRKSNVLESFSATAIYSKFDALKLCSIVGQQRAQHMVNSDKKVHMFMVDDK